MWKLISHALDDRFFQNISSSLHTNLKDAISQITIVEI